MDLLSKTRRRMPHRSAGLSLAVLILLSSCQSPAPQPMDDASQWPNLSAEYRDRTGSVFAVDAAHSKLRVYVYRAGAAARLGHNHVLTLPRFEGYVRVLSERPADASCELRLALANLVVDAAAARAETGGAFSSPRSVADIEGTRRNMLGDKGLDAERYPQMRLRCASVEGDWPQLVVQVETTLHGVVHTQAVALQVERKSGRLRIQGTMLLKQSDYGITPFSVLGGLMAVQDTVVLRFDLRADAVTP